MLLVDVNFTLRGQEDRDDDRVELYHRALDLGSAAWASESQFYLLTSHEFGVVCEHLGARLLSRDFLKVQQVSGPFFVAGAFPPAVNATFEEAQWLGVVDLHYSRRALPAPRGIRALQSGR